MNIGLIPRLNYKSDCSNVFKSFPSTSDKQELINKLRTLFGDSPLFFFDSGRSAMLMSLQSYRFTEGTKAGVMIYNCHTVFNAIRLAKLTPVFIDINEDFTLDLNDLALKSQDMKVLIVTHLFGIITNIKTIHEKYPHLIIIEDCAHAFLSRTDQGDLAGRRGDLSIFSLNKAKFPNIGGGGFLLVNNRQTLINIEKDTASFKKKSVPEEISYLLKKPILSLLHHPVIYKHITFPVKQFKASFPVKTQQYYDASEISKVNVSRFNNFMGNIQEISQKQVFNFQGIVKQLNIVSSTLEHSNGFMVPFLYNADRQAIIKKFYTKGIELGYHFSKSLDWAKDFGYITGSCKKAEIISKKIITIPCYYSMSSFNYQKILRNIPELLK